MADGLNAATKYVATHRPDSLGWGPVEDLGADIMEGVRGVKSKDGPDLIVWGSSTLTSVLLEQGLVDEVVLLVYPVLLGRGKRFFSDSADPRELALVSTKATSTGVLMNTYRHVGSLRTREGGLTQISLCLFAVLVVAAQPEVCFVAALRRGRATGTCPIGRPTRARKRNRHW